MAGRMVGIGVEGARVGNCVDVSWGPTLRGQNSDFCPPWKRLESRKHESGALVWVTEFGGFWPIVATLSEILAGGKSEGERVKG